MFKNDSWMVYITIGGMIIASIVGLYIKQNYLINETIRDCEWKSITGIFIDGDNIGTIQTQLVCVKTEMSGPDLSQLSR